VISNFSPTNGPAGTKVTINGQNLGGATAVSFNTTSAEFIAFDTTQIVATVPKGATNGPITVITPGGTNVSTAVFEVIPEQPPVVTDFSPNSGPVGTEVTLNGQFLSGATDVRFNGVPATFRVGFSGENLLATVPVGATLGPITVVTPLGSFTTQDSFIVTTAPAPIITSFSPTSGATGSTVVINGTNLTTATSVSFNGVSASFQPFGNTLIATVPQAAATGPITVMTPGGSATSTDSFVVTVASAPSITNLSPSSGQAGDTITISGANIDSATAVNFNGVPAATFFTFANSLLATVPANASSGRVTVTTPVGTATSPTSFTVINPLAPAITSFSPETGDVGTVVSVTGTNFNNVSSVLFGGASATFTAVSATQIQATVPAGATSSAITVNTANGTATSTNLFFIKAVVISFDPPIGPVGTKVTVHGVNFTGAIAVLFGGVSADFTNVSPSEIQATVPPGALSGAISIGTPAGFAMSSTSFYLPPTGISFFPPSGPVGTQLSVTGDNLLGVTSVRLGLTELTFLVTSPNSLLTSVPASASSGPITVTTPGGTVTSTNNFYVGSFSDVSVGVTATADTIDQGSFLSYSLEVKNAGPVDADNVVLTDVLPPAVSMVFAPVGADCFATNNLITCNLGTVPVGGDRAVRVTVLVTAKAYLTNQASVTTTTADLNLANNSASVLTVVNGAVQPPPEVALAVSLAAGQLEISWPVPADGFVLETTSSLAPPAQWVPVSDPAVVLNGRMTVSTSISASPHFYRLHKP
jgi:hypothetical protein